VKREIPADLVQNAAADHIQKLSTRAAARAELERRLAELAAREKSLRDRLLTLYDTPTLVLKRDAATERLAEVTATLDSKAGLMSWGELRDHEARRRDTEALIDRLDAEIAIATALREHLADVVAASEGLRTVLTTRVAHPDGKLEAANSTTASDRDALNQRVAQLQSELEAANSTAASDRDASAPRVTELKHKLPCAEQDAAKKDTAHADHIQKLTTELSNTKLAVAAATATIESTWAPARAELERRLAELAAREKSLRDRLLTLYDTPTLVLRRDAATEELAEITELLDSKAGLMSWGELRDNEARRRDREASIDRLDAEIARVTALREHLADVVAASEGLRTVLTTRVAHPDEKLQAANSIAAATAVTATPATGS
jgi:hypothetical protein